MSRTTNPFGDLADLERWVAWRPEPRGGRPTKIPYAPDGRRAKADDPSTWGTRSAAEYRAKELINGQAAASVSSSAIAAATSIWLVWI